MPNARLLLVIESLVSLLKAPSIAVQIAQDRKVRGIQRTAIGTGSESNPMKSNRMAEGKELTRGDRHAGL